MRSLTLLSLVPLAACSTAPAQPVVHGEVPGRICDAKGSERFIGQAGTSATGAAILRATHSAVLRWAPPGYMLTMDFSASRVTVRLGPDYKVTNISCG
jgi:hypothetical protein